jgi:hypothetical protein
LILEFMAKRPQQQQPPQPPPQQDQQDQQDQGHPIADQFSDEEMEQVKRYGQALNSPSDFSDEVEKELNKRGAYQRHQERSAAKMRAAQTGGSPGLGPTESQQALAKQQTALQQQVATTGAAAASQAQAGQSPQPTPPPAPSSAQGVTTPYSAQAGAVGGAGQAPPPQGAQGAPEAPGAPEEGS